jgi:glucosamine-6-phosphate deaminase
MDLQNFHTFNLDEYYPIEKSNKNSYFTEMSSLLFNPLKEINSSFNPNKNSYLLNGETNEPQKECLDYEEKIKKLKGIDLQMLGIGINGHLAFNEPGTVGNSRTRVVDLAEETIQVNADKFFDGNTDKVPKQALSMGIGTILEAKKIFLVASGKSKKNILTKLRNTKIPSIENPASYLLTHPDVTWWLDKDAY